MQRIKVVLADDNQMIVDVVRLLLEPEFEIVASVYNGNSLVEVANESKPDVIIADIAMPHLNGLEATWKILDTQPRARIIFLTVHDDPILVEESFAMGVMGYVIKINADKELVQAIREVVAGRKFISPRISRSVHLRENQADPLTVKPTGH